MCLFFYLVISSILLSHVQLKEVSAFTLSSSSPSLPQNDILFKLLSRPNIKGPCNDNRSMCTLFAKRDAMALPVIPVIGPILTAPPLMIGAEMTLNPPTPLQWKALQECVVVHRNQMKQDESDTATIDAAPLIAIIDESSSKKKVNPPISSFNEGGRYATLVAVVGITNQKKRLVGNYDDFDFKDEESFVDYMNLCPVDENDEFIVPLSGSVRLVGIGRAILRKFFHRVPSDLCEEVYDDDDYDDDFERNLNGGYEDDTPIVMAQFESLIDDATIYSYADPEKVGNKGERSFRLSPVHAISTLFNIRNKVSWIHDDRRKLIAGIKAAKVRLEINKARLRGEIDYDDDLQDLDGLGSLFDNYVVDMDDDETTSMEAIKQENKITVDDFLATFKGNMVRIDPSELPQNQPSDIELMELLENYGMGYYGAFSSIGELTATTMKLLEPYYSESYRNREEHQAEVSSFVTFRVLEGFIDHYDMSFALHCTSSIERLTRGYEIMRHHQQLLKKLAEKVSQELRDCGEECTDLW